MRAAAACPASRAAQDGFTLVELLVVLAIVGVVLAGTTQLFMSAMKSQNDQTNRTQAQQHARLGLDKLRREIRCASALTTPSGYPASSITITLGSYCPTAGGATTVTWCTKPAASGGQPYTLWRYTGADTARRRPGHSPDEMGIGPRGQGRRTEHLRRQDLQHVSLGAATLTPASTGGTLAAGTYSYAVTAVLAGGEEVPGTAASVTLASGPPNQISLSWSPYPGATSYNVYGWDGDGLRLLKNVIGHVVRRHRPDQAHAAR